MEIINNPFNDWSKVNKKQIENVFNEIFEPELLYGLDAIIYDEALAKANHFGTTWQDEMKKDEVYDNFVLNFLENESMTPDDFKEN
jgi:hypothetical protein